MLFNGKVIKLSKFSDLIKLIKKNRNVFISLLLALVLVVVIIVLPNPEPEFVPDENYIPPDSLDYRSGSKIDWDELKSKYKDAVGYLKVPGTTIDEVVVQGKDNDYYLRRGPDKKYRYSGSYYVESTCNMKNLSTFTTIYGHNLRDESTLFGQLTKYNSLNFYRNNPIIQFDTEEFPGEWVVFAVFVVNLQKNDFNYRSPEQKSKKDTRVVLDHINDRSLIDTGIDVAPTDKFLTLYTCYYPGFSNADYRFVVMARRLRNGEPNEFDVSKAKYNSPFDELTTTKK